jgi:hypothetical protein
MIIFAEQYDFAVSLLLLEDEVRTFGPDADHEPDVFDRMTSAPPPREW